MLNKNITIIGAGNMGPAIARGLITNKLVSPKNITLSDLDPERLREFEGELGVGIKLDNVQAVKDAQIVVLAVKPYLIQSVCEEISEALEDKQLLLSIAAGIHMSAIKRWLGKSKHPVVRVMPNTPAQVGMGMSGWTATKEVSLAQKRNVMYILQALGEEIYFEDEDAIDLVTALSGSGPAYFFFFVEKLALAGEKLGLNKKQAESLARQTAYGAIELLKKSEKTPQSLRAEVTSKGGTTEAAIKVMEKEGMSDIMKKALLAAVKKAKRLSSGS